MSITTKLQGGTGNTLFQYAMGLSQARRLKTDLQIDISSFKNDPMREYTLGLFPRITEPTVENSITTIGESGMPYNQALVDQIKDGDVLNGFWQTEQYFADIEWELREKFEPKALTTAQRIWQHRIFTAENPTFVTIRRTDYIGNTFHGELPQKYYWDALEFIAHKTDLPTIFVFTDDTEWCQEHLNLPWPFFVAGTYDRTVKGHIGREDADLYLMSLCKNAVMANSTFSWWGAWLGMPQRKESKGVVVAPKQWFGPSSKEDPRDIVPLEWYII
jgi:hypothetical protein